MPIANGIRLYLSPTKHQPFLRPAGMSGKRFRTENRLRLGDIFAPQGYKPVHFCVYISRFAASYLYTGRHLSGVSSIKTTYRTALWASTTFTFGSTITSTDTTFFLLDRRVQQQALKSRVDWFFFLRSLMARCMRTRARIPSRKG